MNRRGELGTADEGPVGRAQVDEDEVAGGKCIAVRLVRVDAPHPNPQGPGGPFAHREPLGCLPVYDVEEVVGHPG